MKKHVSIGVIALAASFGAGGLSGCVGGGQDGEAETLNQQVEAEPDPHGATLVEPGVEARGAVRRGGAPALFAIDVAAGEELVAVTSLGTLRDTTLTLTNADGRTLAFNDDFGRSYASRIEWDVRADGRVYLQVGAFSRRQAGSFGITVTIAGRVPTPDPEPAQCRRGGCSGQVCADHNAISTCEMRPEYMCYRGADCARQADGECGWTMDDELRECLAQFDPEPDPEPDPGPDPLPADDHGDDLASATEIEAGARSTGIIEEGGDQDWFVFNVGPFGGRFTITTDLDTLTDTRLLATDDGGRQLAENDDYRGGGYASQVAVLAHPFQRIGLRVTGYSGQLTGSYGITISAPVAPDPDPDPEPNDDHADSPAGATAINIGDTVNGDIEEGRDVDWFTFPAGFGAEYVITTELGTLADTTLLVTDTAGRRLADNDDYNGSYASQVTLVTDAEGRLLVKVAAYGRRQTGTYTLKVQGPPVRPVPMCTRDAGEAECAAYGGRFGRFGLLGQVQCICPTHDGGQRCTTGDECQGACVCDGFGRDTREGECSPWVVDFGCYCTMHNGRGATLCVD